MKRLNIVCITFFLTLLVSCKNEENNFLKSDKVVYLTEDSEPLLQKVTEYEKIDLPEEETMASYFHVYLDTILVIVHNMPDPYWLTIMNLKTMKVVANYFKKGNGPEEMLFNDTYLHNNRLLFIDRVALKFSILNLDSVMRLRQSYKPHFFYLSSTGYATLDALTDTSFLFYNSWYLENAGEKINKDTPELIITGADANYNYEPQKEATVVNIVSGAGVLSDVNRQKVFIYHFYKPQITLLNSNLDTIKIICGPEPIEKYKYEDKGDFGGLWPVLYNEYYRKGISTDNFILVKNNRLYNVPPKKLTEVRENHKPEIFKFDWEGNLIARYQVKTFYALSGFSEKTNTLYLTIRDEEGENCLYKAQL